MKKEEVLVIDDNDLTRDALRVLLADDYEVSDSSSGGAALELTRKKAFEVYLVDYNLGEMKGDEVTVALRRLHPQAYIIGFSLENRGKKFMAAGADAFLLKDELHKKLIETIQNKNN